MPRFPDSGHKVDARVVRILCGIKRGVAAGVVVVSIELAKRRVKKEVAVGGVMGEEVEGIVAGTDHGDRPGNDCRAIKVCEKAP